MVTSLLKLLSIRTSKGDYHSQHCAVVQWLLASDLRMRLVPVVALIKLCYFLVVDCVCEAYYSSLIGNALLCRPHIPTKNNVGPQAEEEIAVSVPGGTRYALLWHSIRFN